MQETYFARLWRLEKPLVVQQSRFRISSCPRVLRRRGRLDLAVTQTRLYEINPNNGAPGGLRSVSTLEKVQWLRSQQARRSIRVNNKDSRALLPLGACIADVEI